MLPAFRTNGATGPTYKPWQVSKLVNKFVQKMFHLQKIFFLHKNNMQFCPSPKKILNKVVFLWTSDLSRSKNHRNVQGKEAVSSHFSLVYQNTFEINKDVSLSLAPTETAFGNMEIRISAKSNNKTNVAASEACLSQSDLTCSCFGNKENRTDLNQEQRKEKKRERLQREM